VFGNDKISRSSLFGRAVERRRELVNCLHFLMQG
jgi:hypothetical protein